MTFTNAFAQEPPPEALAVSNCLKKTAEEKKEYWDTLTVLREDEGLPREIFLRRAQEFFKTTCNITVDEQAILQSVVGFEELLTELKISLTTDLSSIKPIIEIKS